MSAADPGGAIEPMLLSAEIERSKRERPDNLEAYDFCLRAPPHFYASTLEGSDKALELLDKALALDPTFASANAPGGLALLRPGHPRMIDIRGGRVGEGHKAGARRA